MVSLSTPVCDFGRPAIDFDLPGTDGARHSLASCRGKHGLLVMFICNHCPYVQAILPRLVEDCRVLAAMGVGVAAIMSNDPTDYPEDDWEGMCRVARASGFSFPYLLDADQRVARAYGAVCTPDFFGYNTDLQLQYRGRFDASRKESAPPGTRRDLLEAMRRIAATGTGPAEQLPGMGCSIKWREGD